MNVRSFHRRLEALRMPVECLVARSKVDAKRVETMLASEKPSGDDWFVMGDAIGVGPLRPPTTPSEYREQQAMEKARKLGEGRGLVGVELYKWVRSTANELLADEDQTKLWGPI